jgi:excisionase family DNA binding protein
MTVEVKPRRAARKTVAVTGRPPLVEGAMAYSIIDAGRAIGVSRSTVFELLNEGKLKSVYVRGRRVIPREALLELLNTGG